MELRSVTAGDDADDVFAQRCALCLIRLMPDDLTARALSGLMVSDPSDWAVSCLPVYVIEALYAPMLGPGSLSGRRPFAYFSVSPAALVRAEDAAAAAGLGFSPAPIDEFATRIRALRVPMSPPPPAG